MLRLDQTNKMFNFNNSSNTQTLFTILIPICIRISKEEIILKGIQKYCVTTRAIHRGMVQQITLVTTYGLSSRME
jgi:hypothetical protein